jgi:hypothetical protein
MKIGLGRILNTITLIIATSTHTLGCFGGKGEKHKNEEQ